MTKNKFIKSALFILFLLIGTCFIKKLYFSTPNYSDMNLSKPIYNAIQKNQKAFLNIDVESILNFDKNLSCQNKKDCDNFSKINNLLEASENM